MAPEHRDATDSGYYQGARVLVTGAAGFIGINLVQELSSRGAQVTALDLPSADFTHTPEGVRIVRADILDKTSLARFLPETDYVFHLAARTDLSGRTLEDYAVNFDGTENVIRAIASAARPKRFVLYSTQLVVGIFNETRFIGPAEPYRTKTLYGQSKILAEKIAASCCQQNQISYTIIRPTSVYGPHGKQPYRDFMLTIRNGRYFHVGKADNLVSMAHVTNVVDQTLLLALEARAAGQVFYANDLHPYTMREFADAAAEYWGHSIRTLPDVAVYPAAYLMGALKLLGLPMPLYPFRLKNIKANYCYDIGNSIELGYVPRYGLRDGVKTTLDWYCRNDRSFQAS